MTLRSERRLTKGRLVLEDIHRENGLYLFSSANSIIVYDSKKFITQNERKRTGPVFFGKFSRDGSKVFSGAITPTPTERGSVLIYDSATGKDVASLMPEYSFHYCQAIDANETTDRRHIVVSLGNTIRQSDDNVYVFDSKTLKFVRSFRTDRSRNISLSTHPIDGNVLIFGGDGGKLLRYDLKEKRVLSTVAADDNITCIRATSDGRSILVVLEDGTAGLFDYPKFTKLLTFELGFKCFSPHISISPNSRNAAIPKFANGQGSVTLWDLRTGKEFGNSK